MTGDFPTWLVVVAWMSIAIAVACAAWVALDVVRRPPAMTVMAFVWPLTMLFGSLVWLTFYLRRNRAHLRRARDDASGGHEHAMPERSMRESVAVGTSHCGAGCALGDLVGEFALVAAPGLAAVFGLGWLWNDEIFAAWTLDFVLAYLFGIAFQYFSIAPMRDLSVRAGIWAAVKADTFSITAWQVGMYGVMAVGQFLVLEPVFGHRAQATSPVFWLVMQVAMVAGFATAYPVNWLLVKRGVKERM